MKCYLGIDPGKKGGLVILDQDKKIVEMHVMPLIGKKEYDLKAIQLIMMSRNFEMITIEEPGIIFETSKSSVASLQRFIGFLHGVVTAANLNYVLVQPKAWQKFAFQDIRPVKKASSTGKTMVNDTKTMSTISATRKFPLADFKITDSGRSGSKNYHDGLTDAALIALYGRTFYN